MVRGVGGERPPFAADVRTFAAARPHVRGERRAPRARPPGDVRGGERANAAADKKVRREPFAANVANAAHVRDVRGERRAPWPRTLGFSPIF